MLKNINTFFGCIKNNLINYYNIDNQSTKFTKLLFQIDMFRQDQATPTDNMAGD